MKTFWGEGCLISGIVCFYALEFFWFYFLSFMLCVDVYDMFAYVIKRHSIHMCIDVNRTDLISFMIGRNINCVFSNN